ncbi:MAG TPA: DPP IV N-terminal domain-containing protein, partial [Roseimicrobium sp.]|nr:DPP IV N-terminal domain-containing protein [Roseimicrobium sp.]
MTRRALSHLLFLILVSTAATAAVAADIDRALSFGARTDFKVLRADIRPVWLPDGKGLWYRVQTGTNAHEFVFIDTATGARKSGPDLKSLGLPPMAPVRSSEQTLVVGKSRNNGIPTTVRFINRQAFAVDLFWVDTGGQNKPFGSVAAGAEREQATFEGHAWLIKSRSGETLAFAEATVAPMTFIIDGKSKPSKEGSSNRTRGTPSPDGKWSAYLDQGKVQLMDVATGQSSPMKTDMDGKVPFRGAIQWSPDSTAFVVTSCAEVPVRRITIVESTPAGQLQPKLKEINYAKPGDPLPQPVPVLFRLTPEGYEWKRVKNDLFPTPFDPDGIIQVRWATDSREFYFDYNQRGHQLCRILAADAKTAGVRVVSEERSKTFV